MELPLLHQHVEARIKHHVQKLMPKAKLPLPQLPQLPQLLPQLLLLHSLNKAQMQPLLNPHQPHHPPLSLSLHQ